jgi:hypothetical protein
MTEFLAAEGETTYELPWTPLQYGVVAFIVLTLMVVIVTRMNRDR